MELSKIAIGAMRFKDRQSAAEVIHCGIDCGFNYIDTSPCYCRQSEEENSEAWVGAALQNPYYRNRVMVSTKCSPGNGGLELGEFRPEAGFGVRSAQELHSLMEQSLRRMNLERVDYYHLWTTHTMEQFDEAMKEGGWYDGVMVEGERWDHLGVTTHADNQTAIQFLESGHFETITIPLNLINTTRLATVDFCNRNGITVFAMNPFAGGFLAQHEELKELALRYLMQLEVHPLIGFSSVEEVKYAKWIHDTMDSYPLSADEILIRVGQLLNTQEPRCTACGYCLPCPQGIHVGAALSYYNMVKYMGMASAREAFLSKQWEDGLRLDRCTRCGSCEPRCPNHLSIMDIIEEAQTLLYPDSAEKSDEE